MAPPCRRLTRKCSIVAAIVILIGCAFHAQATEEDAERQWQEMNATVMQAYQTGRYAQGIPLAAMSAHEGRPATSIARWTARRGTFWLFSWPPTRVGPPSPQYLLL